MVDGDQPSAKIIIKILNKVYVADKKCINANLSLGI